MLTDNQIAEVKEFIEQGKGKCDRCHQTIKIYRYKVNQQIATVLRKMREVVELQGENSVNFDKLNLPYRLSSQRTKMRLHGLIAKVKDATGSQVANTWLITKKGGDFLRGQPIQETVVVYNNQGLGHEGGNVTIHQVMGEPDFEQEAIAPVEAETYGDARRSKTELKLRAIYKHTGEESDITIKRMVLGQPIELLSPRHRIYRDIALFQRDWRIIGKGA